MNGSTKNRRRYGVGLALVALLVLSMSTAPGKAAPKLETENRLVRVPLNLNAYFDGQYRTIKHADTFFGYGWLDDHHVFVATQRPDYGYPAVVAEIINLRTWKATQLKGVNEVIEGGETNFDVDPVTREIVIGGGKYLQFMKVDVKTNTYRVVTIKNGVSGTTPECWAAFWIDPKTVGCIRASQQETFEKYIVPPIAW